MFQCVFRRNIILLIIPNNICFLPVSHLTYICIIPFPHYINPRTQSKNSNSCCYAGCCSSGSAHRNRKKCFLCIFAFSPSWPDPLRFYNRVRLNGKPRPLGSKKTVLALQDPLLISGKIRHYSGGDASGLHFRKNCLKFVFGSIRDTASAQRRIGSGFRFGPFHPLLHLIRTEAVSFSY